MADQAEILRKRREARQKKILASGESRLSKITGTAGTNAQVAPSPAVLLAREQLLKKEQEEKEKERLKALQAAAAAATATEVGQGTDKHSNADESNELPEDLQRTPSTSSATATTPSVPTAATATTGAKAPTVQDLHDADPDDSLGAPPAHVPSPSLSSSSSFGHQQNPFMNNPFLSPQHQALTRMMQDENGSADMSMKQQQQQQSGFGGTPPGFTVITPQVDLTARWWKLLHLVLSVLLGCGVVYREYSRQGDWGRFDSLATEKPLPYGAYQVAPMPVFWYFVTMELILQSTRMALQGVTASPSSTLGTIAGFLPPPFSDAIRVFMRYRLIWTSMVNDLSIVVFIVGLTIVFTHMFS
ncbi:hypothetical protein BGX28_005801 [Mortierella sp. GBA30]|nr:hypothetical protein BGX28_005801 [Mortierella sp. GBA30]